ncbi:MAG TPA: triose-phosphate isomerase [Candidatus Baltobacteraceae bacterium]|nr:triose-phosphate isomerase [Candidatus Baltobacteraceae bacterium]
MRARICAGNWKMFKTAREAVDYIARFVELVHLVPRHVEVIVCPPFTALDAAGVALRQLQGDRGRIKLGAQNMHWSENGAFTGEVSAPMLIELGVQYAILGHSERRQYFGETDEYVRLKTRAALESGLTPIVAVGESLALREDGKTEDHVVAQVRAAFEGLDTAQIARTVIAYEPIWAIGTGKNCDPKDANAVMQAIRKCLPGLEQVPILYGGSVKPENIAQYTAQPEIDGGLVGGASLSPDGFATLAKEAA